MNPVVEAMQILKCDEQNLFRRAYGWFYGSVHNVEAAANHLYDKYRQERTYPHAVLAFAQAVRRNGRVAA
jgi:hypothetical protein